MKPRVEQRLLEGDTNVRERDWSRLVDQLRKGRCLPFVGAGACDGVLPAARDLAEHWAKECEYPFPDRDNLSRVIQYDVVTESDPVTVKERVIAHLQSRLHNHLPDFTDPVQPHALLASLPIPLSHNQLRRPATNCAREGRQAPIDGHLSMGAGSNAWGTWRRTEELNRIPIHPLCSTCTAPGPIRIRWC